MLDHETGDLEEVDRVWYGIGRGKVISRQVFMERPAVHAIYLGRAAPCALRWHRSISSSAKHSRALVRHRKGQ